MITYELREYANDIAGLLGASVTDVRSALEEIADHIDQRYGAFIQGLEDATNRKEDVTIFGVGYSPLPLDSEGNPIHIGDWVRVRGTRAFPYGRAGKVVRLHIGEEGSSVSINTGSKGHAYYNAEDLTRADAEDSWEAILLDARADGASCHGGTLSQLVERCKRLAGEE